MELAGQGVFVTGATGLGRGGRRRRKATRAAQMDLAGDHRPAPRM